MAEDPERALEKLSEYRKQSKSKKTKLSDDKEIEEESLIRAFFVKFYWFNAAVAATIGFAFIIAGWAVFNAAILWVLLAAFSFILTRQTLVTIMRLEKSEGRKTTIDDAFVIILIAIVSLFYNLYLPIETSTFRIIHIPLVVIWLIQIYFVNFRKPEIGSVKQSRGGIEEMQELTAREKFMAFFTTKRIILLGISFVLAILLSLNPIYSV